ncbi:F-box domain-containing protein [Mycena sanguinolenta]|uniref:F-box domain-containing protein n=1 Tax=Mycena sanguinolenta TaxID=230812 RepID=A0A8H6XU84_9AGAR|nr:F-box domain-containing protein [Mycena sanguinolenta]
MCVAGLRALVLVAVDVIRFEELDLPYGPDAALADHMDRPWAILRQRSVYLFLLRSRSCTSGARGMSVGLWKAWRSCGMGIALVARPTARDKHGASPGGALPSLFLHMLLRGGTGISLRWVSLDIHWLRVTGYSPDPRILDLVLPHSNRWRAVSFSMVYGRSVVNWLEPVRGKLGQLLKLEFANVAHEITFSDVFMTVPNLRQVIFDEDTNPNATFRVSIPIPWEQITHYGGSRSVARQISVLEAASNLSNCALDMTQTNIIGIDTNHTLILPQLRRLCVDPVGLQLHIVAPNLEELCCASVWGGIPYVLPFLSRASCTLQRLVLWEHPFCPPLIDTLRNLPSLTYLLLHNRTYDVSQGVKFFDAMTTSGRPSDICPLLTSMVYGYEGWEKTTPSTDAFVGMARSRFRANSRHPYGTQFTSLRLFSTARGDSERYCPPTAEILARIQSLQIQGFNVAFLNEDETAECLPCRRKRTWSY